MTLFSDIRKKRDSPKVSIIIPLFNEEHNIVPMHDGLVKTLIPLGWRFELIFVNDGSTDQSESILNQFSLMHSYVTAVHLMRNKGKAAALEAGVQYAQGQCIVIIDCDLQYDPNDVVRLIAELDKGFDMVSARRMNRADSRSVIFSSRIFNFLIGKMTGLKFVDYFSGLKCFNREVLNYLSLYGPLYRFAVVYAFVQGFKVTEIPVNHYARSSGGSHYNGIKRFALGIADVLTVLMTVVLNPDRIYYLNLLGLFLMMIGLTLGLIHYFWPLPQVAFHTAVLTAGFGLYSLILKKISSNFFDRHQTEFTKRQKNVRRVVRSASADLLEIP